mgnify:FL=1
MSIMSSIALQDDLRYYLKNNPNEKINVDKMLEFLNKEQDCFSRSNLRGHFTGSAWVVDETHKWILMTHHRKLDKWLQLGGHADENENLFEVAHNEAVEESGLIDFTCLSKKIFDIDIHKIPQYKNIPPHYHYDIRYLFKSKMESNAIVVSKESKDVAWVLKDDVFNKNNEESIMRMLTKCEDYR